MSTSTALSKSLPADPVPDAINPANSVLGKLTLLLAAFGFEDPELSLSELVRRSGLTKPTVHRLCTELTHWGYLERSGTDYRLGIRLFEIGQRVSIQCRLRDATRPYIEDLQRIAGGVAHLAVRDGTEVLYLEKITGHRSVQPTRIGGRMPMHCTATGKVLLAFAEPDLLTRLAAAGLTRLTPYTIIGPAHLARELTEIRTTHIAREVEETRCGYLSIAAPISDGTGSVLAAISLTVPSVRANLILITQEVKRAARASSNSLAGLRGGTGIHQGRLPDARQDRRPTG